MLYALLCGYPPFFSDDNDVIKRKILKGKIKFEGEEWDIISNEAKDLISKMLVPEEQRPSARECLDHDWFHIDSNVLSTCNLSIATLDRLKTFSKSTLFR